MEKRVAGIASQRIFKMKRLATIHGDSHDEYYRQVPPVAILEPFLTVSQCRIPGLTPIDVTPIVNPAWPSVSSHPPAQAPFALVEANNFFYADMRRRRMTPRYSTCWEELPVAVLKYTYNSI